MTRPAQLVCHAHPPAGHAVPLKFGLFPQNEQVRVVTRSFFSILREGDESPHGIAATFCKIAYIISLFGDSENPQSCGLSREYSRKTSNLRNIQHNIAVSMCFSSDKKQTSAHPRAPSRMCFRPLSNPRYSGSCSLSPRNFGWRRITTSINAATFASCSRRRVMMELMPRTSSAA